MTNPKKVIVVGAGHNGLVCGAYLARAGHKVTLLEAASTVGGMTSTHEFAEGYRVSSCAHLLYQMDPEIITELELDSHGLRYVATGLTTTVLSLDGDHLRIAGDQLSGGGISPAEQTSYPRFVAQMRRFAEALRTLYVRQPPRLNGSVRDALALAAAGWKFRRMGRDDLRELLRVAGSNIHDIANERFDNDLLRGALGFDAVLGTHLGTRSGNSMLTFLHRLTGQVAGGPQGHCLIEGGVGTLTSALRNAAAAAGATIRTHCSVRRLVVEKGRVVGVAMADGETIRADVVVSNADPKTTFLTLLGAKHLEAEFASRVSKLRARGNAAKLHIALDALPNFGDLDSAGIGGRLLIAPSSHAVDTAFNPAKYGEYSPKPVMEITLPSVTDPKIAPNGKHVLSAVVQYAPYDLREGWDSARDAFEEVIIDRLAEYAPDIRNVIIATELMTPTDIELQWGATGGHWHHVELALDQFLMMRPTRGAAQYASPVRGLYLCGAGSHPGGSVMGLAGKNAATAVDAR